MKHKRGEVNGRRSLPPCRWLRLEEGEEPRRERPPVGPREAARASQCGSFTPRFQRWILWVSQRRLVRRKTTLSRCDRDVQDRVFSNRKCDADRDVDRLVTRSDWQYDDGRRHRCGRSTSAAAGRAPQRDSTTALARIQVSLRSVGASRPGHAPAALVAWHLSERRHSQR
jgi:hypothetical protein